MGASHGKVKIAADPGQPPGCYASGTPPLKPPPSFEQMSEGSRHPRLRLKQLFRIHNDFDAGGDVVQGPADFDENKALPKKPEKKRKSRRGLFKSKLEREVYENLYSELPMQTIMLEDVAPSTSVADGDHSGQRRRREPRVVKEVFDHRVLVKYSIKALIGKGSFSRVVKAENRGTGESFAMKLVAAKDGRGPFENELAILSRLDHPNLIRLHEVIRSSSRVYLVTDLASGGELYEHIVAKGRFSEPETISTIRQILHGLEHLHRLGITHRDLKPENVLYTHPPAEGESRILITDFGLAFQQRSPDQRMTETCGTPEYIAPEVLMRFPYDRKIDMWSCGVIAYILLSGIMPFDSESRTRLYRQIIRGKYHFYPEFFARVSSAALGFVSALLDTEPESRLSAAAALAHPWMGAQVSPRPLEMRGGTWKQTSPSGSTGRRSSPVTPEPRATSRPRKSKSPSPIERTRSSRSIRSVARSDHTHRVKPQEVERLWQDPELRRIVFDSARHKMGKSGYQSDNVGTVVSVPPAARAPNETPRSRRQRRTLGASASDNFCIVGFTASLPRPDKAVKEYGLL